jgi:hypothetical protein
MPVNRLGRNYQPNPRIAPLGTCIGFVKRNDDAQRMGRLSVFIPELGGDPEDPGAWVIVGYASPFAGATDPTKIQANSQTMDGSQQSYGFWMIPPDINNEVAVFFANNDITRGYWFACCFQQAMNQMIPGIATDVTTETPNPNVKTGPVVEYNKVNVDSVTNPRRPRFTPLSDGLAKEGLTYDNERGSTTTSARREAPSQVFGFLTPRGNSVHVDDNVANEFIRLRTRSGAQVLIHETSGYVYINSKNGNSWIEVSDAGVDIYTAQSISMRAEQDVNIRADRDILFDAGANIRLRAKGDIGIMAGANVETQAGAKINFTANSNIELITTASILGIAGIDFHMTASNDLVIAVGNAGSVTIGADLQIKATSNLRLESGLDMTQLAIGRQIRDGVTILDNTRAAPKTTPDTPATITPPVLPVGLILGDAKQGVVSPTDQTTLWRGGAAQVNTIVRRMPTHEPWRDHPNADVPPPPTTCIEVNGTGSGGAGAVSTNADGSIADGATASNVNPNGSLNDAGCSPGASGTKKISTDVYNAIMHAASQTGADPATMLAFADIESSFQPGIAAKGSSATGLYQFTNGTWQDMVTKYGSKYNVGRSQINDAQSNALMGGQFLNDNAAILKKQGISNPTPGQCYIMHFAGSGGGPALIQAAQSTPDASAALAFPAAARANPTIFQGKTCAQVVANLSAMADSKAKAYSGQYGLPAPCDRAAGKPATALDPTAVAAAAYNAPAPIDMNTPSSGSVVGSTSGDPPTQPPPTAMNVPTGGSCDCTASNQSVKPNANGYAGVTTQSASLLNAAGLPDASQWQKGSTDPTTWVKNQPIAIFDSDGQYHGTHAAIFLGLVQEGNPRYAGSPGLLVYDQSPGQPTQERIIPYNVGNPVANNAGLYAAVNTPGGSSSGGASGSSNGGGSSGGGGSNSTDNSGPGVSLGDGNDRVASSCVKNYHAHTGDCSGFVKAVSADLGVTLSGMANDIVKVLQSGSGGWRSISGGSAALASAKAGKLVVAGMLGSQQASPDAHGHVVVVVSGPMVNGKYPSAYWGSLGGPPGYFRTLNYSWTTQDRDRISYAEHDLA